MAIETLLQLLLVMREMRLDRLPIIIITIDLHNFKVHNVAANEFLRVKAEPG